MSDLNVKEIRKKLGLTQAQLASNLGVDTKTVQNWEYGKTIPISKHGILRSLLESKNVIRYSGGKLLDQVDDKAVNNYILVPMCNLDAVGGMSAGNDVVDSPEYIEKYIPFVDARKGDVCMPVSGNSMIPVYPPGCIVLLREVFDWNEYFGYGNDFVLILQDGRRLIKGVRKSNEDAKNNILCVSYNTDYDDEELPKKFIQKVYRVLTVLINVDFS